MTAHTEVVMVEVVMMVIVVLRRIFPHGMIREWIIGKLERRILPCVKARLVTI